nr:MAG TPA: putative replisome organizer protein [Caudoviricetes sp.]
MYTEYLKHVQKLSMEQRGELFTAILCYASGEEMPELDLATDMIFGVIQERIDRDTALYLEKVQKRVEAGKLGGRPKANGFSEKHEKAKKANGFSEKQNNPDNEYINDNDNVKENINTLADAKALFERLWKMYPNKKGKGQVSDTQKKRLLVIGETTLVKAIERYSLELQKDADWRKPQYGSTFFNSGYVDYLDENYSPGKDSERRKNSFNNFDQRQYNYDDLERKLLNSNLGGE